MFVFLITSCPFCIIVVTFAFIFAVHIQSIKSLNSKFDIIIYLGLNYPCVFVSVSDFIHLYSFFSFGTSRVDFKRTSHLLWTCNQRGFSLGNYENFRLCSSSLFDRTFFVLYLSLEKLTVRHTNSIGGVSGFVERREGQTVLCFSFRTFQQFIMKLNQGSLFESNYFHGL